MIKQKYYFFTVILQICLTSCSVIKGYQKGHTLVLQNKVVINTALPTSQKISLSSELNGYWATGLKVQRTNAFVFKTVVKNPPIFDSMAVNKSIKYMTALLATKGYYNPNFSYSTYPIRHFRRYKNDSTQLIGVKMAINLGKPLVIDSVNYVFQVPVWQKLINSFKSETKMSHGNILTKESLNTEKERLSLIFHNHGYLEFSPNSITISIDTNDLYLLNPTLDPAQLFLQGTEALDRVKQPVIRANISFLQTTDTGISEEKKCFNFGNLYFYPETKLTDNLDSLLADTTFKTIGNKNLGVYMKYKTHRFSLKSITSNLFIKKGQLYNQNYFLKTISTLNQAGAWQQIDVRKKIMYVDSLPVVSFSFFMYYIPRYNFVIDFQTARVSGDINSGNLLGIANVISFNDRNAFKRGVQSSTTLRTGVELNFVSQSGNTLVQTLQPSLNQSFIFSDFLLPFKLDLVKNHINNRKTIFNFNASYTNRTTFYRLLAFTADWSYQWQTKTKHNFYNNWTYTPLEIGLYRLDTLAYLDSAFKYNPYLKNSFTVGYIVSQNLTFFKQFASLKHPNILTSIKFSIEESGGIIGLIPGLDKKIYRYVKLLSEYKNQFELKKTVLALRFFIGLGVNYIGKISTLPFFKQFTAGGANSMRGWQLRQLGLGSSITTDTLPNNQFKDRYGDMQLEFNIEYRFPIVSLGSVKLAGAIFSDFGNIWNIKATPQQNATFSFKRLGRDIAIASGLGLRIDISNYFLLRFDWGYKVKDPARQTPGGWLNKLEYADTRSNGVQIPNMALQFGIGLPF
ncbi:MAG: BamA/TamA family outer membrane protein [Phycisphaerales bacterium]|nr:BamA/TamA family outer membrane protein [Phycisphaerales bacterium]